MMTKAERLIRDILRFLFLMALAGFVIMLLVEFIKVVIK